MDEEGNVDPSVDPNLSEETLKVMYHMMVLARMFDEKFFKLQRSGKIGTYASLRGQEASEIGSAMAMEKTDWMIPSFREMGVYLTRGADRVKMVQSWKGDARAFHGSYRDLPVAIPIASQTLIASGIAWAAKLRGEKVAAVTYFGDGATAQGDWHEAMNFASVYQLPVVFVCQNNHWAISTPTKVEMAVDSIAQRAIAYNMKSIQVDGNDVMAVYVATKEALDRAKRGEGPTLVENVTYRMGDHTTSDDSSRYRSEEEVKPWIKRDPILRLKLFLQKKGWWTDDYGKWVEDECQKEIDAAVEKAMALPPPPPEELFDHIYEKLPPLLEKEKAELLEEWKDKTGGAS
ncbi:MAG: pyruvate dehydrogenase (acetyl-transferring) E1 component subunit alpha [Nanoarchaeota archaeon]